jgi:hypothetical protein
MAEAVVFEGEHEASCAEASVGGSDEKLLNKRKNNWRPGDIAGTGG